MSLKNVSLLIGHTEDRVWHISWSPNGQYLASCGEDKVVRIWSFDNKINDNNYDNNENLNMKCIATLEEAQSRTIRCCEWSPNGRMLSCASFDGTVIVWESLSINLTHWDQCASLEGHDNEVKCVSWNNDGRLLATCGRDKKIWIWEKINNEFECISMLEGHTQDVKFIKFHKSLPLLFSTSYDDTIKIWQEEDDDEWKCTDTLTGHDSTVWSLALNNQGNKLISVSDDKSAKCWICDSPNSNGKWRCNSTLKGLHSQPIYTVDWSLENSYIVTGGGDNNITISTLGDNSDGNLLTLQYKLENAHDNDVNCVRWNPHKPSLLASSGDDGLIKLWYLIE